MGEAQEIDLPDIAEVEKPVMLAWEKEITGFYITGHPLDAYADKIHNLVSLEKILAGKLRDGQLVRIGGLLTIAKRIATKKGDTMCFAALEDFTHSIEVIVFPRVFYQNVNILVPEQALMVQGKVNLTDDGAKILADNICTLDEYQPDYYITLHESQENESTYAALKEIFSRYHGSHVVYLHLVDRRQRIKTEPQFWLDGTAQAEAAIEMLLGKGTVRQR